VISWQLAVDNNLVRLSIYDLSGREVAVLVNEVQTAGIHKIEFNGSGMVSGMYFYRLSVRSLSGQTGEYLQTRKMILMK
jgi:hypothetical protein